MSEKYISATRRGITEIAILFASIYLTFIVDVYTLNTWPKRIFVFCYFLIMCHAAIFLKRKFLKDKQLPKHMLAIVGFLAAAVVVLGHNTFFPKAQETTVSLAAVPCEDGSYHEVWLTSMQVDGQEVQLSQLELDANQGWTYSSDYDDYVFYPTDGTDNTNYLTFKETGESIELTFAKNAWSGAVELLANERPVETLSLVGSNDNNESASSCINAVRYYAVWKLALYGVGAWLVIAFCLSVCVSVLNRFNRNKNERNIKKEVLSALILLNAGVLFFSCEQIQPTTLTKVCLLVLTGFSAYCVNRADQDAAMSKYRTRGCSLWIMLISAYASFVSFGQRFFLNGNTRMHGSLSGLFYCISGFLWFLSIIWMLLNSLEWLAAQKRHKQGKPISRRRAWWTLFLSLAVCQLVVLWIMWPGGFPADAIDQLSQVVGVSGFNDWHPVIHTLFEKLILSIVPVAGAITAVQMICFTWILTSIMMFGYDQGVSLMLLTLLGGVFEFLPNQALSWSNVLKDFPFTLALLWGLFLLVHLAIKSQWSTKVTYYICLAIDLFLIMSLRHNGVIPGIFVMVLCVVLTLRYYSSIKWKALASVLGAAILFAIYKGPLFTALNVKPNGMSPYTTMLCAVGSCINKDLPLSDETTKIMERVIPIDDWAEYYSRYHGHDIYWWGRPDGSVPYDTSSISARDAFLVYFEALKRYPDVVIKDRLDGMDIMWDVVQPTDGFNAKAFNFISPFDESALPLNTERLTRNDDGSFVKDTILAKAYYATEYRSINSIMDILLWRTGAYLIAFLVLLLFWWKNQMGRLCWAAVPMLGNIAGSILVLYHQSFRYVYFIQVSVLALIFITVVLKQNWNAIQERKQVEEISDEQSESEEYNG